MPSTMNVSPNTPTPENEEIRLRTLHALQFLEAEPDSVIDNLVRLAAAVCRTPIAFMALVDQDRILIKSQVGTLPAELPRGGTLCFAAVSAGKGEIVTISDAAADDRFSRCPFVAGEPHIRCYAGAPLTTGQGVTLGTLCVADTVARSLTAGELAALGILRDLVLSELERRLGAQAFRLSFNDLQLVEEKLRQSEEQYRAVFENTLDAILVGSPDGRIFAANAAAERMFQRSEEELKRLGRDCLFGNPTDANLTAALEERHRKMSFAGDLMMIRKDGTVFPVEVSSSIFYDGKGEECTSTIIRDISDRRAAEVRLRESEERYRGVIENAIDVIFRLSTNGRIISLNPAFERATGWSVTDWVGEPFDALLHPDDVLSAYTAISLISHHKISPNLELRIRSRDGGYRFAEIRLAPELQQGIVVGLLGIGRDISRRKEHEEQLLQSKQLAERVAQTKSRFLAMMSHEIRTPLHGIIGMTDLLRRTRLSDDQMRYLDTIRVSGDSLLGVINDILDFSKIEAGKMEFARVPVSLTSIVNDAIRILQIKAEEKNIRILPAIDPDIPRLILGDDMRIRQVLINLIGNAIKFSDEGEIEVSIAPITRDGGFLQILFAVKDRGIGIPHEQMEQLFEPFSQADSSSTRRYGGTGLGLAICANLVSQMGGTIWAESEEGKGSTFYFSLPTETVESEPAPPPTAEVDAALRRHGGPGKGFPLRILLTEDNPINQAVAREMLSHLGHEPDIASSGEEALTMCRSTAYDLVFMDIEMAVMDGLETARRLRQMFSQGARPLIIAMTAYATDEDRAKCLAAGMNDFLRKPVTLPELEQVLEESIRHLARPADPPLEELVDPERMSMLQNLQRDTNPSLLNELIELYNQFAESQIQRILNAASTHDTETLGRLIHALKGSSQNLGLTGMISLCRKIETELLRTSPAALGDITGAIPEMYRRTREALDHYRTHPRSDSSPPAPMPNL